MINKGLINLLINKFEYINQYNLYLNNKNYENYTRKLFSSYLPFPMMYNQPSKYYAQAQEQVKILGLSKQKLVFDFTTGNNEQGSIDVANGLINDEDDEDGETKTELMSPLVHYMKTIIKEIKIKTSIKESRNSMKCLILITQYIERFKTIFQHQQRDSDEEFGYIFNNQNPSSSEILFYAYIFCLTYEKLPDRFIFNYLKLKQDYTLKFITEIMNKNQISKNKFRNQLERNTEFNK